MSITGANPLMPRGPDTNQLGFSCLWSEQPYSMDESDLPNWEEGKYNILLHDPLHLEEVRSIRQALIPSWPPPGPKHPPKMASSTLFPLNGNHDLFSPGSIDK